MNQKLAFQIIEEMVRSGVKEFCICPGSRNSPIIFVLESQPHLKKYYWFEERSAAFFAMGLARQSGRPVAVVTTSGTAAAELLPATIESYYTAVPLILLTADRPRRFRGSNAPQSCEQVGLFGVYTPFCQDLDAADVCDLAAWDLRGPLHVNACFEEPERNPAITHPVLKPLSPFKKAFLPIKASLIEAFCNEVNYPFVIVGKVEPDDRQAVIRFLLSLKAPILAEASSGIREEPCLSHLMIYGTDHLVASAKNSGYPIDSVIRIGGIPTNRFWRDLEETLFKLLNISDLPFTGVSFSRDIPVSLASLSEVRLSIDRPCSCLDWVKEDHVRQDSLIKLFQKEPLAESSLIHKLSHLIPPESLVFLGTSLPIREWDMAATRLQKNFNIQVSRGINGIDGQLATVFGLSEEGIENWAILGDLTTLYDMAAPWILPQISHKKMRIVVINNGGGQLFSRIYAHSAFLNAHTLSFKPLAEMWGMKYERWEAIPESFDGGDAQMLIEIVPAPSATERFWEEFMKL